MPSFLGLACADAAYAQFDVMSDLTVRHFVRVQTRARAADLERCVATLCIVEHLENKGQKPRCQKHTTSGRVVGARQALGIYPKQQSPDILVAQRLGNDTARGNSTLVIAMGQYHISYCDGNTI